MKRILAVVLSLMLLLLTVVPAAAAADYKGLNGFFKSSRSDFVGQGGLTKKTQVLETFDTQISTLNYHQQSSFDTSNKKEGKASLKLTASGGVYKDEPQNIAKASHDMFSGYLSKSVNVTDPMAQALGMWFYVEDIDTLPCDHDSVYNKFQENCGTIFMRFGYGEGNYQQWNHTLYGDGWHYVEFAFNSMENTPADTKPVLQYNDMSYIRFVVMTQGQELTVNVDEISLITYETTAETPAAPGNGRWLTTGDYNVLDGATVTEWMGAYYDTENKSQGSSSLMVHGRDEHVDFREVVCGFKDFAVNIEEDVFCVDLYIEDMSLVGTDWSFSFYDLKEENSIVTKFSHLTSFTVSGENRLQNGWNTVRVPFKNMVKSKDFNADGFEIARLKIYCSGANEEKYYNIGYDNMYIAKASELANVPVQDFGNSGESSSSSDYLKEQNKDKLEGEEDKKEEGMDPMIIVAIAVLGGAVILVVVLLIVVIAVKKKKTAAPAPQKAAPAPAPKKPEASTKESDKKE